MQAKVVEIVNRANAQAQTIITDTKQQAEVQQIQAESKLQATRAQYGALKEEAASESKNLEAFDAQRAHQLEIRKADVYCKMAKVQKNIVVSG